MIRALCVAGLIAALASGCVTVYQPVSGLHRPIAIDIDYANFDGMDIEVHCLPGPVLDKDESQDLCRRVARLFENQGAAVETSTRSGRVAPVDEDLAPDQPPEEAGKPKIRKRNGALDIELSHRLIHKEEASRFIFWTRTVEYTFAQDITIRDETGFLLVKDTLVGRFTTRLGFSSDADEEFSRDYYRLLSQDALNARLRRRVLVEAR